jgi:hypothetical protein
MKSHRNLRPSGRRACQGAAQDTADRAAEHAKRRERQYEQYLANRARLRQRAREWFAAKGPDYLHAAQARARAKIERKRQEALGSPLAKRATRLLAAEMAMNGGQPLSRCQRLALAVRLCPEDSPDAVMIVASVFKLWRTEILRAQFAELIAAAKEA